MRKLSFKLTSFLLVALLLCLSASAYSVTRRGDRNADGKIELADVLLTLKDIVSNTTQAQSDINGDGKVTLADAVRALRYSTLNSDFMQNIKQFDAVGTYYYNYCPSVMQMDNGDRYVYYCTNKDSRIIVDYIGCRVGTLSDGSYSYGEELRVLAPGASGKWDSVHVCDPSVIKGDFTFDGEHYDYLMAYLGCNTTDNTTNQIGLAVSNDPYGAFTRVSVDAPFIAHPTLGTNWGVGQASLVSAEPGTGLVYLFYTEGADKGTLTRVEQWDLSDLNNPVLLSAQRQKMDSTGLKTMDGTTDNLLNDADFAFDPDSNTWYMTKDARPYDSSYPNFIGSAFCVAYSAKESPLEKQAWNMLEFVGKEETGFARNHNVCFVRDAYGWLPSGHSLTVFYTRADSENEGRSPTNSYLTSKLTEWTYRIYEYTMVK